MFCFLPAALAQASRVADTVVLLRSVGVIAGYRRARGMRNVYYTRRGVLFVPALQGHLVKSTKTALAGQKPFLLI